MSNLLAAFKVSDQIVSRLFDHRQFTNGQVDYLVKGLDDTRLEDNLDRLLKINERVCVILDKTHGEAVTTKRRDSLVDFKTDISQLVSRADNILQLESQFKNRENDLLSAVRAQRKESIDEYKTKIDEELLKFVKSSEKDEEDLRKKYSKLEISLMKNNPI